MTRDGVAERQVIRTFPAQAMALRDVREFVRAQAEEANVPHHELSDLQVAISEACTNVVRHAGVEEMKVRWRVEGDRVEVEVEDDGVFVDRPPDLARAGGFGISLMRSLMDEVVVLRGDRGHPGTRVLLVKRLADREAPDVHRRRSGPRTRRLHPAGAIAGRRRRIPAPNLAGFAVAAVLIVAVVMGTLAVVHTSHPHASLAATRSPAPGHSATTHPATVTGARPRHGTSQLGRTRTPAKPSPSPARSPRADTQQQLPEIRCPSSSLLGVYAPVRFDVAATCRWVRGRVASIRVQLDGNHRIVLTSANGKAVVVEIILAQRLPLPRVGERVAAIGTLVRARGAGWTGLEPTWAIDYLDRGFTRRALPPAPPLFSPGSAVCVPSLPFCASVPTPSVSVPVSVPSVP